MRLIPTLITLAIVSLGAQALSASDCGPDETYTVSRTWVDGHYQRDGRCLDWIPGHWEVTRAPVREVHEVIVYRDRDRGDEWRRHEEWREREHERDHEHQHATIAPAVVPVPLPIPFPFPFRFGHHH